MIDLRKYSDEEKCKIAAVAMDLFERVKSAFMKLVDICRSIWERIKKKVAVTFADEGKRKLVLRLQYLQQRTRNKRIKNKLQKRIISVVLIR